MYTQFLIIYKWQWAEVWMRKIQPSRDFGQHFDLHHELTEVSKE